ncbi:MAG: flagellar export chaperone FliS [Acetobacteraceae bacterium]|nr:flagellar export chaperone FliS [Acetobacteraceae bacterium]
MATRYCQQYRATQVETAGPVTLVTMMYDGALGLLAQAEDHLGAGRLERASRALTRAQAILTELTCALNFDAGDLARRLEALYTYMKRRLVAANLQRDPGSVAEVRKLLQELRDTWVQATGSVQKGGGPVGTVRTT